MASTVSCKLYGAIVTAQFIMTAARSTPYRRENDIDDLLLSQEMLEAAHVNIPIPKRHDKLYGEPLKITVTIGERGAATLRDMMGKMENETIKKIKNKTCGNLTIEEMHLDGRDIPSSFYGVKCPKNCPSDDWGDRRYRSVGMKMVYFRSLGDATKSNQYEVWSRHKIVGCCLEDNDSISVESEHQWKASTMGRR